MLVKTTILLFCGYHWIVNINEGHYRCETWFDDDKCELTLKCFTGQGSYDKATKIVTAIAESKTLVCTEQKLQEIRIEIENTLAAKATCVKD